MPRSSVNKKGKDTPGKDANETRKSMRKRKLNTILDLDVYELLVTMVAKINKRGEKSKSSEIRAKEIKQNEKVLNVKPVKKPVTSTAEVVCDSKFVDSSKVQPGMSKVSKAKDKIVIDDNQTMTDEQLFLNDGIQVTVNEDEENAFNSDYSIPMMSQTKET